MARTRATSKTESQQAASPVKMTLTLPAKLAKQFGVHAEMECLSKSDLFAALVESGCKRYVVHDHSAKAAGQAPGDSAKAPADAVRE